MADETALNSRKKRSIRFASTVTLIEPNPSETDQSASGDSKILCDEDKKDTFVEPEDIETLKEKLSALETRYSNLIYENEQTNIDLVHEKNKVLQLERQLQLVKDNQTVFEKLRQAYINMKYNESSGKKLVEIRDKSVQTWDGVLCRACLDTEKLRSELEHMKEKYNGCFVVNPDQMAEITATISALKGHLGASDVKQ